MKKSIRYITRKNLNVAKYDACIQNAINTKIYAYSWYLDIVADNWDVLVMGDYEMVMPLPWRKKYFIKYVYVPVWTQQLGIFSEGKITDEIIQKFIGSIPIKFLKVDLLLNDQNKFSTSQIKIRNNYVLSLKGEYEKIYAAYSKNRRQTIKKNNVSNINIGTIHKALFPYYKEYIIQKSSIKNEDLEILDKLMNHAYSINKAFTTLAYDEDDILLGGAIFLEDNNRLYYLFSALNSQRKKSQAMSFIIDKIIAKYSNTDTILDFEGSMISGIASFFRSFGAENIPYYHYTKKFIF